MLGFEKSAFFDHDKERLLLQYLVRLRANESVLNYFQLQGLFFAMACSPERIKPSEWFDLIWLSDEPQFDDEHEAKDFLGLLIALYDYIEASASQRRYLPFEANYSIEFQHQLAEWTDGFLMGHQYLEDLWFVALDDLDDEDLIESIDRALALAIMFSDYAGKEQMVLEADLELNEHQLADAYGSLWQALSIYSRVGPLWLAGHWEYDAEQMFLALESVPRDQSCPCGSGLPFSRCCLH